MFIATRCALARASAPPAQSEPELPSAARAIADYERPGSATYLTLPEWFIVYNTEEYASFIAARGPARFPHFRSALDFWRVYWHACDASCGAFPFDTGNHVMLIVIGASFTAENVIKGVYENTAGRLAEALGGHTSAEDASRRVRPPIMAVSCTRCRGTSLRSARGCASFGHNLLPPVGGSDDGRGGLRSAPNSE